MKTKLQLLRDMSNAAATAAGGGCERWGGGVRGV